MNAKDLAKVIAKDPSSYDEVALTSLTAYSLYWLHEWQLPRTIEAVAVLNWRLFPDKFAMVGYIEYPDAFRTNRSLLQMQPKYRNLLTGAATKGFSLNSKGIEKAKEMIGVFGVPTTIEGTELGQIPRMADQKNVATNPRSIEPKREIAKIRTSKLFEKWKTGALSDRDLIHVHALLGIFDHTPTPLRVRALKTLTSYANEVDDQQVKSFIADIKKIFPQVLSR